MAVLNLPPVIEKALDVGASVAVSVSGGKDSDVMAKELAVLRDAHRPGGVFFALHMDLGRAEWKETPAHVERIAERNGFELLVVRRPQGDLVQEIEDRKEKLRGTGKPFWPSSASRYCTADQKRSQADKVYRDLRAVPFWPSATNRYCTSHQKANQADKVYRQHDLIISAEGIRAQESPARRKKPPVSIRTQITSKPLCAMEPAAALWQWLKVKALRDAGDYEAVAALGSEYGYYARATAVWRLALTWFPIFDWDLEDVWQALGHGGWELGQRRDVYAVALELEDEGGDAAVVEALKRLALDGWMFHPAYVYGNERLSCALCVLASDGDIRNGARHNPEVAGIYLVWEAETGCSFKNGKSLAEILA